MFLDLLMLLQHQELLKLMKEGGGEGVGGGGGEGEREREGEEEGKRWR